MSQASDRVYIRHIHEAGPFTVRKDSKGDLYYIPEGKDRQHALKKGLLEIVPAKLSAKNLDYHARQYGQEPPKKR